MFSREGTARTVQSHVGRVCGRDDALTMEVFLGLDLLPRTAFMDAVLNAATGAVEVRTVIAHELELSIVELKQR